MPRWYALVIIEVAGQPVIIYVYAPTDGPRGNNPPFLSYSRNEAENSSNTEG